MDIRNMKNIVILKDLPSNMIEEAFVVLKDNVKVFKQEPVLNNTQKYNENMKEKNNKDYVIKEAEMIVSNYVSTIEKDKINSTKEKIRLEEKCKRLKYSNIFFIIFSVASIISIIIR